MVGASHKPSGGRRNKPIHSIPNSIAYSPWRRTIKTLLLYIIRGEILELEVDKIVDKAVVDTMISLVRDGLLELSEGAKRANMTQEEFERKVNDV